jgi:hypothetical protein
MVGITKVTRLFSFVSIAAAMSSLVIWPRAEGGEKSEVRKVASKELALSEFQKVDRNALTSAVIVKIERVGGGVKSFEAAEVASLAKQLKVSLVPSSAGEPEFRVHFMRKEHKEPIRTIWIMKNGEWGVMRPGTSWTTGKSLKIRDRVQKLYHSK